MEHTTSMTQEDIRTEMRKLAIETTKLKNLVGKMKNSLEGLIFRVTSAEDRIQ